MKKQILKPKKKKDGINTRNNQSVAIQNATAGITLIALVITIIILLILARSNRCSSIWRKWNDNQSYESKRGK